MGRSLEEIEKDIAELSEDERADLLDRLNLERLNASPEIEKAWAVEVERRIQEIEDGTVECEDVDDVIARIRAKRSEAV